MGMGPARRVLRPRLAPADPVRRPLPICDVGRLTRPTFVPQAMTSCRRYVSCSNERRGFMIGKRKAETNTYEERALDRLRSVMSASSVFEGADPDEVRKRLENTTFGRSRRPDPE